MNDYSQIVKATDLSADYANVYYSIQAILQMYPIDSDEFRVKLANNAETYRHYLGSRGQLDIDHDLGCPHIREAVDETNLTSVNRLDQIALELGQMATSKHSLDLQKIKSLCLEGACLIYGEEKRAGHEKQWDWILTEKLYQTPQTQ